MPDFYDTFISRLILQTRVNVSMHVYCQSLLISRAENVIAGPGLCCPQAVLKLTGLVDPTVAVKYM